MKLTGFIAFPRTKSLLKKFSFQLVIGQSRLSRICSVWRQKRRPMPTPFLVGRARSLPVTQNSLGAFLLPFLGGKAAGSYDVTARTAARPAVPSISARSTPRNWRIKTLTVTGDLVHGSSPDPIYQATNSPLIGQMWTTNETLNLAKINAWVFHLHFYFSFP